MTRTNFIGNGQYVGPDEKTVRGDFGTLIGRRSGMLFGHQRGMRLIDGG
jgi:hypothetical protein